MNVGMLWKNRERKSMQILGMIGIFSRKQKEKTKVYNSFIADTARE
jgi:hypothetical protein